MSGNVFKSLNLYRHNKNTRKAYIDISLDNYREIYNEWDFSPQIKKDLDSDLLEFLKGSAEEIPDNYKIEIVCHLPEGIRNPQKEQTSSESFRNIFRYNIRRLDFKLKRKNKEMAFYAVAGLILITLGNVVSRSAILPGEILGEGFYIGGWVLFWELFSTIFFNHNEYRNERQDLKRLYHADISYHYIGKEEEASGPRIFT